MTAGRRRPLEKLERLPASRRLAANQSGGANAMGRLELNLLTAAQPGTDPSRPVQLPAYRDRFHNPHAGTAGNP